MSDLRRVEDFSVGASDTPAKIAEAMLRAGGFAGRSFAEGVQAVAGMWSDPDARIMMSFPAALMATGMRGVIVQMLRERLVDLVVTTCGTLDHDLARTFGNYYEGDFLLDDEEVERKGYHRLGSVLVPKKDYGELVEEKMQGILEELYSGGVRRISTSELTWEIGRRVDDESSLVHWAYVNRIPVVIPGPMDGAVGLQLWLFNQRRRDFQLDVMHDEQAMSDFVFESRRLGGIIIGGGISKHHLIWWAQFKEGLDYAVYVTTAVEYDGSLSGAPVREAVSWGKVKPAARKATVYGDASLVFPFLVSAALGISGGRRRK
ncbi:MAG: deoxyhypusine synthase [Conexivisphaera sp.]|jgi:deoxyhypusine synthase